MFMLATCSPLNVIFFEQLSFEITYIRHGYFFEIFFFSLPGFTLNKYETTSYLKSNIIIIKLY